MRYKKIKSLVENVVEPSVEFIKRSRGRTTTPFKEIEAILKIFFPHTKHEESKKGFFKHVFIIHSSRRRLVLKMGRKRKDIRKDYVTYKQLCNRAGSRRANEHFAKIYWRTRLFMLQKYGKQVVVPTRERKRLKEFGDKFDLKDTRDANIMKFGNRFKIVDAERKKRRSRGLPAKTGP
jgi:hypothetical protein